MSPAALNPRTQRRRERARRRARRVARTLLLAPAVVGVVAVTVVVWAFWTSSGIGSGAGTTGTLSAPTVTSATPAGSTVTVNWTEVIAPDSGAVDGYYVLRYPSPSGSPSDACGQSPASPFPAGTTTCNDTGVLAGNYTYTVVAKWRSWTAESSHSAVTVAASKFALTSAPVSGNASSSATLGPITVQAQDSLGNSVMVASNTVVNLASNSSGTAIFAALSGGGGVGSVTIPSGSSSTTFFYGDTKAGSPTITASGSLTSATQTETITAATATSMAVSSGSGQSAAVNTAFTNPLVALVKDSFNNPVPGVTVTFTAPGSGASGTFAGGLNTAVTDASGLATSATFTANTTVGGPYNVSAAAPGAGSVNFSLTNSAGAAASIVVSSGSGQSAAVNTAFTNPLIALVKDSFNNPVPGVTVTFTAPGSGASETFAGGLNTAVTDPSGLATSATFTANTTAGGPYNVSAAAPGAGSVNFSLTNNAGAANKLAFVQGPSTVAAGSPMVPAVTVQVVDTYGNPVSSSGVNVTLASTPTVALTGNTAATNGSGLATFNSLVITTSGNYTLTASGLGTPPTSSPFTVYAGGAGKLVFLTGPQTFVEDAPSGTITVQRQDASNNPVTSGSLTVNLSSSGGSSPVFTPASPVTIPNGSSTVSFRYTNASASTPTITAAASGLTSAIQTETVVANSGNVEVTSVTQQAPFPTPTGQAILSVVVKNTGVARAFSVTSVSGLPPGATVTNFGGCWANLTFNSSHTFTVTISTSAGTPAGTSTVAVVATRGSNTSSCATPSGTDGNTGTLTINPAAANKLAITSVPVTGSTAAGRTLGPVTVQVQDQNGNPVNVGSNTTVNLSSTSPGGTFAATSGGAPVTSVTIPSGSSSVNFYYGDTTVGSPTITAASGSFTSATQTETIIGPPSKLAITTSPVTALTNNGRTAGPITVQVQDLNGNPVNVGSNTTVNLSSTSPGGTFAATSGGAPVTSVTVVSGSSSVSFYYGDTTQGPTTYPTITAASSPLTSATQIETVTDNTPPTVVSVTPSNANGTVQVGDHLDVQFSENVDPSSVAPQGAGAATVTFSSTYNDGLFCAGGSRNNTTVSIPGLTAGALDTGAQGWVQAQCGITFFGSNTKTITYNGTLSVSGATVTFTITNATPTGDTGYVAAGLSGTLPFAPAAAIKDLAGNAATGTTSASIMIF